MATREMLYDRLLVRPLERGSKTKGGLYVPDIARENTPYLRGEVVAAGHGRLATNGTVVPLIVKEGDVILFFRNAGSGEQLVFEDEAGEELLIIREPNVAMILRDLKPATGLVDVTGAELVLPS